jgi:hypothetical protein
MSFNFEFVAGREDARQIIGEEHAPACVKDFLLQALTAWTPDDTVLVKASGHLYTNDYETSTCTISVTKIVARKPKPPTT